MKSYVRNNIQFLMLSRRRHTNSSHLITPYENFYYWSFFACPFCIIADRHQQNCAFYVLTVVSARLKVYLSWQRTHSVLSWHFQRFWRRLQTWNQMKWKCN